MKGIILNEHYGIESATLDGRINRLSLNAFNKHISPYESAFIYYLCGSSKPKYNYKTNVFDLDVKNVDKALKTLHLKPIYKIGDIIAIKQTYNTVWSEMKDGPEKDLFKQNYMRHPGAWRKLFVKNDIMPHQIQITDIKFEYMSHVSTEDCLRSGVFKHISHAKLYYTHAGIGNYFFETAQAAYASLMGYLFADRTCSIAELNIAYYFKLIK